MSLAVETWGKASPITQWIDRLSEKARPQESGLGHKRLRDDLPNRGRS